MKKKIKVPDVNDPEFAKKLVEAIGVKTSNVPYSEEMKRICNLIQRLIDSAPCDMRQGKATLIGLKALIQGGAHFEDLGNPL